MVEAGQKFKLFDTKNGNFRYDIVVDWVHKDIVGHHIEGGKKLGGRGSMQCTLEDWQRHLKEGRLY